MTDLLSINPRYDLGLVIQCTTQHGASVYLFANDIVSVEPRRLGVYIIVRGHNEEFWVGCGKDDEETKKHAEKIVSTIASIRMNGVDKI